MNLTPALRLSKPIGLALAGLVLMLGVVSFALAAEPPVATSAGYEIFRDVEAGGGETSSAGYTMQGQAVGEATTIETSTSAGYRLRSGYLFQSASSPEMAVLGNSRVITNGTTTPSLANHTDFGAVAINSSLTRTFTISNSGTADLTLTGSPRVTVTNASTFFSLTQLPSSSVISNSTTVFKITYTPTAAGVHTATVTIENNDSNENPYTFMIQGGTLPTLQTLSPPSHVHTATVSSAVSATYDQNMDNSTVSTGTFAVHAMATGLLTETYSVSGGQITLTPAQPFKPGELVQVSATTGTLSLIGTNPITPIVWQFRAAAGPGSGSFIDSTQSLGSVDSLSVALGDVDGDNDLDAFVANDSNANHVWLNDGTGSFTDSGQNLGSANSRGATLGDVDGDGDLDTFVVNYSQPNQVWLNDGTGVFTDSGQSLGSAASTGTALGDVDGDGDLDAFVTNYGQPNQVWLNDGTGVFTDSGQSLGSADSFGVALGDVDGDGDLDAFVSNDGQANEVWLNNGAGVFTDSGQSLGSDTSYAVALGDVDGDGDLDAFVANTGFNNVWLNNGAGVFTDSGQNLGADSSSGVALGDVDGDGDLDAFVSNDGQPNEVWVNDGTGTFSDSGQNLGSADSNSVALGDVDGDGDLDAFIANTGANKVWLNQAAEVELAKSVTPTTAQPGDPITYTLTFANNGPDTTHVIITDAVPISITNINIISSGAVISDISSSSPYVWQLQNLASGQGGIITITGQISFGLSAGSFTNTAIITGTGVDTDTANNTASAEITVGSPELDLAVSKLADSSESGGTTTITYTVTVDNLSSTHDATGVVISDTLPISVSLVSTVSSYNETTGVWQAGNIAAGGRVTLTLVTTGTFGARVTVTNTAAISSLNEIDTNASNDRDSVAVTSGEISRPLYFPILLKDFITLPDLIITDLQATSTEVTITIINTGTAPVVDSFWIDVYFGLDAPPTVNQPWPTTDASHGVVWGLSGAALPIMPGESRTLTLADATEFFDGRQVTSDPPYPVGVNVYGYVDSVASGSSFAAVEESNEGNNVFGPITSGVTGGATHAVRPQQSPIKAPMPAR